MLLFFTLFGTSFMNYKLNKCAKILNVDHTIVID